MSARAKIGAIAAVAVLLVVTTVVVASGDTPPPFPSQYVAPCTTNSDSCRQSRAASMEAHYKTHGHPAQTVTVTASPSQSASSTPPVSSPPVSSSAPASSTPPVSTPPAGACVKPTAANTGVSGTRTNSSVTTLSTNGQTLENVNVSSLTITGDNVTVRNVEVAGRILVDTPADNTLIDKVTTKHIGFSSPVGTTVQNSRITASTEDGLHVTSDGGRMVANVTIKNNLIDDPRPATGSHYDGLQIRGVNGLLVECNTFNLGPYQDEFTAAIFPETGANGGHTNVRILDNWLDGGGFIIYADNAVEFSRNRFGNQARWGICYGNGATPPGSGNVKDADNTPVDLAVECR